MGSGKQFSGLGLKVASSQAAVLRRRGRSLHKSEDVQSFKVLAFRVSGQPLNQGLRPGRALGV